MLSNAFASDRNGQGARAFISTARRTSLAVMVRSRLPRALCERPLFAVTVHSIDQRARATALRAQPASTMVRIAASGGV